MRIDPCGAHSKSTGEPCKRPGNGRGGRCRYHGGLSSGPKTAAGKVKARACLKQYQHPSGTVPLLLLDRFRPFVTMWRHDHQPSRYIQHGVSFGLDGRPQLAPGRYLRKRDTGQV